VHEVAQEGDSGDELALAFFHPLLIVSGGIGEDQVPVNRKTEDGQGFAADVVVFDLFVLNLCWGAHRFPPSRVMR
jgi:hypothetical protein